MATYTFTGDLRLPTSELFGPKLNQKSVNLLHPDMHVNPENIAAARARIAQRATDRIAWMPGLIRNNHYFRNGDTVTAIDARGEYLQDNYSHVTAAGVPVTGTNVEADGKVLYNA